MKNNVNLTRDEERLVFAFQVKAVAILANILLRLKNRFEAGEVPTDEINDSMKAELENKLLEEFLDKAPVEFLAKSAVHGCCASVAEPMLKNIISLTLAKGDVVSYLNELIEKHEDGSALRQWDANHASC